MVFFGTISPLSPFSFLLMILAIASKAKKVYPTIISRLNNIFTSVKTTSDHPTLYLNPA
jgi:hypothetical protein